MEAALGCGMLAELGQAQLGDELLGQVREQVRPHRPDGHGDAWRVIKASHELVKSWRVDEQLTVVKAHELLERRGIVVSGTFISPSRLRRERAVANLKAGALKLSSPRNSDSR